MKAIFDLFVIAGVCVVMLVSSEIGARLILRALDTQPAQETADPRAELPPYANSNYDAADYWRQFRAAKREVYHPYIVWRQQSSTASLINVDTGGIRETHYNSVDPDALQVWLLGGSTMWGMGTPDAHTIPSYVAKILNEKHHLAARVRNLGDIGYVSTQELTQLIRELQVDRRPDVVVFLDGVNDAPAAALWPDIPGSHMNLYSIRNRFEHHNPDESAAFALLRMTGLYRLAEFIAARIGAPDQKQGNWTTPAGPHATKMQGNQAAEIWLSNIRIIKALGRTFDFEPIFLLQPSLLVGEKTLHRSEQRLVETEKDNAAKKAGMEVYEEMRQAIRKHLIDEPLCGVYDRTDLFRDVAEPLYIDYVHIAEQGNELIAAEITKMILAQRCEN